MKKSLFAFVLLIFSSYNYFSQINWTEKLPESTIYFANFNFGRLNSKIDLDKIKQLPVMRFAEQQIHRTMGADSNIFKKFYNDPTQLGINLTSQFILAAKTTKDAEGNTNSGFFMVFPLANVKKFDKFIKSVFDEGTEYKDFLELRNGKKIISGTNLTYIWDAQMAYIFQVDAGNRENLDMEIDEFVTINSTNCLRNTKDLDYNKMLPNDMSFWFNTQKINELQSSWQNEMFKFNTMQLSGNESYFAINFENGKITANSFGKVADSEKELQTKLYGIKLNEKLFDYVNGDSLLGMVSMSYDIKSMKEDMVRKQPGMLDSLEKMFAKKISEKEVDKLSEVKDLAKKLDSDTIEWEKRMEISYKLEELKEKKIEERLAKGSKNIVDGELKKYGLVSEDIWSLLKGDFLIAATGSYKQLDTITTYDYKENLEGDMEYLEVEKTELVSVPLFVASASVNNTKKLEKVLTGFVKEGHLKNEGGYYLIIAGEKNVYVQLKNDILLVSNDLELVKKGPRNLPKVKKELVASSTQNPMFFYFDSQKALEKIPAKTEAEIQMLKPLKETFDTIEGLTSKDTNEVFFTSGVMNFKPNGNAIQILFELANTYFEITTNVKK